MGHDLRFALRSLARSPGFTLAAALVLAVGIGAAAAMFVLVDGFYFRGMPGVADARRLVDVRTTLAGRVTGDMSYPDFADLRAASRAFAGLLAWRPVVLDVGRGSEARRVPGALVSSDYFAVLGASAVRGRTFAAGEERPSHAHPVAVVSDRLWRADFAADAGIVGRSVVLNGRSFTVVGVAAPGFVGHEAGTPVDIWVPLSMATEAAPEAITSLDDRGWRWLRVEGRLAPGAGLEAARAEAQLLAARLRAAGAGGGEGGFGLTLEPAQRSLLRDSYALLLVAGVVTLFVAVCANLSSLFLARMSGRRLEIATRLALGAPRARILRRLLAESVLVGLLGGALGLVVAPSVAAAVVSWGSAGSGGLEIQAVYHPGDMAAFALVLSLASGVLLGLGPALRVTRVDLARSLREGVGGRSPGRSRLRGALVAAQLAISLVLLSGGGLLARTLWEYRSRLAVADPRHVLLASVQPSHQGYGSERQVELFAQLAERVAHLPGVVSATLARDASLQDASFFRAAVAASREGLAPEAGPPASGYDVIAPDFFRTMGTPLVRGREFAAADRQGAPPVVIVNEALARRLWPGGDPVGRTLWITGEDGGREVVGVARDRAPREGPQPFLYFPLHQRYPWPGLSHELVVRTAGAPLALLPALRRAAGAVAGGLVLYDPRVVEREAMRQRFFERFAGAIVGGSGVLALLLAAIGLYGLTSRWVSLRTNEIGVRMALGARTGLVVGMVVRRALELALVGVGIGLVAALAVNRVWSSLLYRARPADPVVLGLGALVLITTAALASWLPARRAARVDPAVTLRCE